VRRVARLSGEQPAHGFASTPWCACVSDDDLDSENSCSVLPGEVGEVPAVDFERIETMGLRQLRDTGPPSIRTAPLKFEDFQRLRGRTCRVSRPVGESSDGRARRRNRALAEWAVWLGATSLLNGSTISTYVANVFRAIAVDLGHARGQSRRHCGISTFYAAIKVPGLLTMRSWFPSVSSQQLTWRSGLQQNQR